MKCSHKLRRFHDERMLKTHSKLVEGLARMISGETRNVSAVVWTKSCWADEAGVNVNTIVTKGGGKFVYEEANMLFEQAKRGASSSAGGLRARIRQLEQENLLLKQQLAAIHRSRK